LYASDTAKGQFWSYTIQVFDGESFSFEYDSLLISIENSVPEVVPGSLSITPSEPIPWEPLTLVYTWFDADVGDIERDSEIHWYKNNVLQPSFNDSLVIDESYLYKDDRWNVTIKPGDGSSFGNVVELSIIIGNTRPEVITNGLGATTAYTTTSLNVNTSFSQFLTFYDADGDTIVWIEYKWYVNNVENSTYYNQTTIPASETTKGEQWQFTLQIADPENRSDLFYSVILEIQNTPPEVSNVAISPGYTTLYTNNTLDLYWDYFDADFDPEIISQIKITWYKNGLEQPGLANLTNIPVNLVNKGDNWMVEVQVFDGAGFSNPMIVGPRTIQNTQGIINNIFLNNNVATMNVTTDINLNWAFIDADGDGANAYNITWFRSTNAGVTWSHQPMWNNLSTITALNLTKGEAWFALISIFDGETWSRTYSSQVIAIINAIPQVDTLLFVNTSYEHFLVEDELIQVSYVFFDADSSDNDQSTIMWFINGIYQPQYDNLTIIPASETAVGQLWSFQVVPGDGTDSGVILVSEEKIIEDRPEILSYGVQAMNDTEGHYIFWFNVSANPVNSLSTLPTVNIDISVNNTLPVPVTATSNGTHFIYEWTYKEYSLIGSKVTVGVAISSRVVYSSVTSIIASGLIFDFLMLDTAPPRVKDVDIVFDDNENPSNITFLVLVEEFGSGIDNATIYYAFVPPSESQQDSTVPASKLRFPSLSSSSSINFKFNRFKQTTLSDSSEDFNMVQLTQLNATHYSATVDFQPSTTVLILYQIQIYDKSGNYNLDAYPEGLDETQAVRFLVSTGIPLEQLIFVVIFIMSTMVIFSFIIIKKFRSKELVGLDIDLVIENIQKLNIKGEDIKNQLDLHTLGVVISFFDQQHGPIPVIFVPEILRDNFTKLIELSDLSFSTGHFMEDFEIEEQNTFTFNIDETTKMTTLSYSFALNRPNARGGAENMTLNILIYKEVFPLISQFTSQIRTIVNQIHKTLDLNPDAKKKVIEEIYELRKLITKVVLSHIDLYGSIEIDTSDLIRR
ncbi:MAG: hypothetical protein ACXAC2_12375, partial [Candidatus Kariarchaeaceae archaeon]